MATLAVVLMLSACGGHVHHRVKEGESLYAIGFRYGYDYRKLAKWNDIPPPYVIHEGEVLRVAPPVEPWWAERERAWRTKNNKSSNNRQTRVSARSSSNAVNESQPTRSEKDTSQATPTPVATDDSGMDWRWPTRGRIVTRFAVDSPLNKGIDIAGEYRQPVHAAAGGRVVYSGNGLIGYGNLVIIKHNQTYLSAYAHNDRLMVSEGETVSRGQQIATMGRRSDEEVLLHFEIRRNGDPVDPLAFIER